MFQGYEGLEAEGKVVALLKGGATVSELNSGDDGEVVLDQTCCAFDPHVMVVFPYYTDGKDIYKTGQVLLVK